MRPSFQPTPKLIVAAICLLAGLVILWRTFGDSGPALEMALPTVAPRATIGVVGFTATPTGVVMQNPYPSPAPGDQGALGQPSYPGPGALESPSLTGVPTVLADRPTVQLPITPSEPASASATPAEATVIAPTSTPMPAMTGVPLPTAAPTEAPTVTPSSVPTAVPTDVPTATFAPTLTWTPEPTAIPATSTPVTPSPTPSSLTVVYRVEGNASQVTISYIDEAGREQKLQNAPLPWEFSFNTGPSADLAIDAFSDGEVDGTLLCSITVNGVVVRNVPTDRSTVGVQCEKLAQ